MIAAFIIWTLVGYQFLLSIAGYFFFWKSLRDRDDILLHTPELPPLTILIPAHNEEKVIERTVRSMLALDYPAEQLEVFVINDASTDATGAILDRLALEDPRIRVLHRVPPEGGCGKGAALNAAMLQVSNEYVAIYDADNRPEPNALKLLVAQFLRIPDLGAVVGKFRTGNKRLNLLTRCINIEGLSYQGILQAGRWCLWKTAALTGTNYVIRRSALERVGGWDVEALAEDAELSVRLYQDGYKIAYVPVSISWEQEPETVQVWLKQRTRWARGSNYAIAKAITTFWKSKHKFATLEMIFTFSIPYQLLFVISVSLFGLFCSFYHPHPFMRSDTPEFWWLYPMGIYYLEVLLALSYDNEDTLDNMALTCLMYFTYLQAWPIVYIRAIYADFIKREKRTWDKTVRFDTAIESSTVAPQPVVLAAARTAIEE
jgi:cellulose synthase/poly-beta-1,6-N-acetylglucosamine synthase-like glycosyltransferase